MSSNQDNDEQLTKSRSKPGARTHEMTIVGAIGLACSVIDLGVVSVFGILIIVAADSFIWGTGQIFLYFGIALGAIGLVLGIAGATRDQKKFHDVVAIVAGCIAIAMISLI
ncbi:MAG TPA: hypothetical protein VKM55_04810 [Candidatus Lokiarchaeia archaeon]|nr:hypothetical protein [Candidatus Lokiarchaeia archaeon]